MAAIIIGIDCATEPKKRGIAVCRYGHDTSLVTKVATGLTDEEVVSVLKEEKLYSEKLLLALDAPLGWPASLGEFLTSHNAGEPLPQTADKLFRRETDRFIRAKLNKQPLDVGADRIARTAHAALNLLAYLSESVGCSIPLAWSAEFSGIAAIEVYPSATLRSCGLPDSGYKAPSDQKVRQEILDDLDVKKSLSLGRLRNLPLQNADALDALICCLAGLDFLQGSVYEPPDEELSRKEGWIWVRER